MRNDEKTWERYFAEQESSGLSRAEYCKRRGISDKRFYYWHKKLKRQISVDTGKFAAVSSGVHISEYKIELANGVRLLVPGNYEEDSLKRLISVLSC